MKFQQRYKNTKKTFANKEIGVYCWENIFAKIVLSENFQKSNFSVEAQIFDINSTYVH